MQTISACLVVYNEGPIIERCLRSLDGVVDEIIIVHDGECGDNTIDICRKYTDQIYIRDHGGFCDPHRPFTFEKATCDWVLYIDADEYLSTELRENLRLLVDVNNIDAYEFVWPYCDGKRQLTGKYNSPYRLCLARKTAMYYWGFPHEPLRTYGNKKSIPYVMEHWPKYDNFTYSTFRNKQLNWIRLHAQHMFLDASTIERFNIYSDDYIINLQKHYIDGTLISSIFDFLRIFCLQVYGGRWNVDLSRLKIALLAGSYEFCLAHFVRKLNRSRTHSFGR